MKLNSRSADPFEQVDLVVNNPALPAVASPTPWHKQRGAAARAAAMLALAAGLFAATLGAVADEPARFEPTAKADTDCHCMQPTAEQFLPPNQPDINPSDARAVDELYHLLIGPQPANSLDPRSSTGPSGNVKR